jgi:hypothetical protein
VVERVDDYTIILPTVFVRVPVITLEVAVEDQIVGLDKQKQHQTKNNGHY